ncbi:hypothetical protein KCV87_11590 [Actinosynnema pretiosum subsp. pretiosum]|uniref:Uncharacterized protein n=3 Tax=Actinosynnema TaxID=40566 RepID=C6WCP6_ACTMD|nr:MULTISPECIES: hypothetical protein [Actinosynnema]ACU35663.1 hypothetical protein Amir_1715 [Actinosynnema mirum DSM 43827]ATE53330.1 hypothetical protein CNX65_08560 [Actinosynnema pretiosum]QUF06634.1 hypothetical protein KCV87_11590 [Actinosynnema pretiosum subsp. pretiosum]
MSAQVVGRESPVGDPGRIGGGGDPFACALRTAIRAKGLSLERIQHRLRGRGSTVSIAALSYWQSGRRRPERPDSLTALAHLEEILDLGEGALRSLLGPPRPRGKARPRPVPASSPLGWVADASASEPMAELLADVDTSSDHDLTRLSLRDQVELAMDGSTRRVRSRQVLRAERGGVDRVLLGYDTRLPGDPLPVIGTLRGCSLGRVATDPRNGLMIAELLFDRPLRRGERTAVEYELIYVAPHHPTFDNTHTRRFRHTVKEYVLEVRYDSRCRPARCEQFTSGLTDVEPAEVRETPVDAWGYAYAVAVDFGPGVVGLRWEWA